jgi:putative peptidoglycan lipid II flippase
VVVAGFTALSRVSGVARVLVVGAVLGATQLGNAYQVTNTLPNLVWYGFLAGSLLPSVLVPMLVRQLDSGGPDRVVEVSRGFLGVATLASLVLGPLAVLGLPLLMRLASLGVDTPATEHQVDMARLLVVLTVPQILLYALVGTAAAVMYSHGRFALASAGPALENVGVIAVLVTSAVAFRDPENLADAPAAQLVLLGAGSTAAVALNAAAQWWGAYRRGVALFPTGGWRDPDVSTVLHRAGLSVLTAGLLACQTLLVVLLASRVTGGVVGLQIALNFYAVAIALIATPIGLALLPQLSRLTRAADVAAYRETFLSGLTSALFLAAPASVGYVLLAGPMAAVVSAGRLSSGSGELMISGGLAALAVGLVGETITFTTTQAAYVVGDVRTPYRCMQIQVVTCAVLCVAAVGFGAGPTLVIALALAFALSVLVGGCLLLARVVKGWPSVGLRLWASGRRIGVGCVVMVPPVLGTSHVAQHLLSGRPGEAAALLGGTLVGVGVFILVQRLLKAPELAWWLSGLRRRGPAAVPVGRAR